MSLPHRRLATGGASPRVRLHGGTTMSKMNDVADIRTFVTAGNATFTLSSVKTGVRYTYKVYSPKKINNKQIHFVLLLTGPDNTNDYTYIGMINEGVFRTTAKSTMGYDSPPVAAIAFLCRQVMCAGKTPDSLGLEFRHQGKCGRCGRALTVPDSVDKGLGPSCQEAMGL